ncbi:MAG: hypothetical protein A3H69_03345 [Candidatus Sungbacteria bacterium RIFCSPLOWO2_02_FULL_47_9]|nr:MAG: hypothetical protein UX72_C0038G0008 [Parcubacteria group bacterium GW2011_GWA2_47_10]OHA09018.1 MAG: hypothetical protein A3H69_03345 [Candidatus Sungbacteria bacterium RIFCSPLOWO2_02_FULL_47_9]
MKNLEELLRDINMQIATHGNVCPGDIKVAARKTAELLAVAIAASNDNELKNTKRALELSVGVITGVFSKNLEVMQWVRQLEILVLVATSAIERIEKGQR